MPEVRKWHVDRALYSSRSLTEVIEDLTMEEVEVALAIESATRRRGDTMRRLIGKAVRLNEQQFMQQLIERYKYAPPSKRSTV